MHVDDSPLVFFTNTESMSNPVTAYLLYDNTYDPGTSPGSANQCILGDVYLRSNLPRQASDSGRYTSCLLVFPPHHHHQSHPLFAFSLLHVCRIVSVFSLLACKYQLHPIVACKTMGGQCGAFD